MTTEQPTDAAQVLPPEGVRLLIAATHLQDENLPAAHRAAWRLEAYLSGMWQVVFPPLFDDDLSLALRAVADGSASGSGSTSSARAGDSRAQLQAICNALEFLEPGDVPLRAKLNTEAAEVYLRRFDPPIPEAMRVTALEHARAAHRLLAATTLVPSAEAADMCTVITDSYRAFAGPEYYRAGMELAALAITVAPDGEDSESNAFRLMLRHNLALFLLDDAGPDGPSRAEAEFARLTESYKTTFGQGHPLTVSVVASLIRAMQKNGGLERIEECIKLGEDHIDADLIRNPHRGRPEHANLFASMVDVYVDRQLGDPRANLERAMVLSSAAIEIQRRYPEQFRDFAKVLRQRAAMERFTDRVSGHSSKPSALRYAAESLRRLLPEPGAPVSFEAALSMDEYANCLMMVPFSTEDAVSALHHHAKALDALQSQFPDRHIETYKARLNMLLTEHQITFQELSPDGYFVPTGSFDLIIERFRLLVADTAEDPEAHDTWIGATSQLAHLLLQSRVDDESVQEAVALGWASMTNEERSRQGGFNRTEAYLVGTLLAERGHWLEAGEFFQEAVRRFRLQNGSLLSIESKMANAREGAGLSVRAAYCLGRANRIVEAAAVFEDSMDLWLNDVRRSHRPRATILEHAAPPLWAQYQALAERLATAQAKEIRSGRPWILPGSKTEFGDEQREIQQELESVRGGFAALTAEVRKVEGFEDFSFLDEPVAEGDALELDRPVVYLGVSGWGGVAVILDGTHEPEVIFDESYDHDDLVLFLAARELHGDGYSHGQLGDEGSLAHALTRLESVAPRLIDDLARRLVPRGGKAILIPSGAFALLPIHAMGSTPLGSLVAISYLTSLSSLSHPARRSQPATQETRLDYLGIVGNRSGLPDENGSIEIRSAAAQFDGSRVELLGADVSADAVTDSMRSAAVIHFVGHGQFDLGEPQLASIVFEDGTALRFTDIYKRTDFAETSLVVISACKTAVRARIPAESISIASSFLTAGAHCALGTLWETNDLASTLLVSRFFELHFGEGGRDFPESLQEAQRWLRESTRAELLVYWRTRQWEDPPNILVRGAEFARPFESPLYWAAYVLMGDPIVRRWRLE